MQETVIPIINPLSFLTRPSLMHSLIVLIQKNLLSHPSENDKVWKCTNSFGFQSEMYRRVLSSNNLKGSVVVEP
jgi:hypothetical protein